MKTSTLIPAVVQVVRESLSGVLGELFREAQIEQALNRMDREIAHSVVEGARQALEQVLTQSGGDCPGGGGEDSARLGSYAIHTALGVLQVMRWVYQDSEGQTQGELDMMQLWRGCTYSVREESSFLLAQGTAQEAREAMQMFRPSVPSESTIKRLVATDGTRMMEVWDTRVSQVVQEQVQPMMADVDMVSVSADGAMVPLRGTADQLRGRVGDHSTGSTEPDDTEDATAIRAYREARIITVTLYGKPDESKERTVTLHDEQGRAHGECVGFQRPRLTTIIFGEMPGLEGPKGRRAQESLGQIIATIRAERPDVVFKGTTDGGHWPEQTVDAAIGSEHRNADFYHGTEHLRIASKAAYGDTELASAWYKRWRNRLLTEDGAAQQLAAELSKLASVLGRAKSDEKVLRREAGYFEKRASNMKYAELLRHHLVIGSGLVEAAVKRLITLRMKRTGATWSESGGNAILVLRGLRLSGLWDTAWRIHIENEVARYAKAS